MRFVSDRVEEVSTTMMISIVVSSLVSLLPIALLIFKSHDSSLTWAESSSDYKILWAVFILLLLLMGGLFLMFKMMKIEIKANEVSIDARMTPFMRSFRVSNLSDVNSLEIVKIDGIMKYGGVGLKKNLGGLTSYTMTGSGQALRIKMKDKKELHVQITKVDEWERYIRAFKNPSV